MIINAWPKFIHIPHLNSYPRTEWKVATVWFSVHMYPSKNSLSGPIQSAIDTDDDVEYKKPQTFAACLADTFVSPSFDFVSIPHVLSLCVSARYFRWLHISWGNFSLRLMSRFPRLILNRGYHLKCLETCVFLPPITSCCVCTSRYSYNDTRYCTGEGAGQFWNRERVEETASRSLGNAFAFCRHSKTVCP